MWKHKARAYLHRLIGGSLALVGALTQLKEIDLSQLIGAEHAGKAVALIGLVIVALEFVPIMGQVVVGDEKDTDDAGSH